MSDMLAAWKTGRANGLSTDGKKLTKSKTKISEDAGWAASDTLL